jgi:hypothetical protein
LVVGIVVIAGLACQQKNGKKMIEDLINLADNLDKLGLATASDEIDRIIKEAAKKKGKAKKRTPTDKALWSRALAEAKKKFKVFPSAYANGWAVQWYKKHGGGWRGPKPKR